MPDLTLKLDLGPIQDQLQETKKAAEQALAQAAEDLAAMTYNKIAELAQARLRTSRQEYLNNLSYEKAGAGAWTVTLGAKAMWIEEGMDRHEMIADLLKNGRMAKDGSKYQIIPFPIKAPTATAPGAMAIRAAATLALRKARINMKKVEKNADGSPKIGTLHRLDVTGSPLKTTQGVYQGWGALGAVRQGPTGIPFLSGLSVQQRMVPQSNGLVQKTAMTFRVVSSKHMGTGRWVHPGVQAKKLMDEAFNWAQQEWTNTIKPGILEEVLGS